VGALFDNNRLVKNPFKTIKKYEDILIKRGLKLEYEEENKTIIIRPVKNDRETLASKALQDIIPGLPNKNITYLKIPATKLAFLLSGYQANYAAKCRENTSDDKIKEYEVVLNWYHSPLKKPEIFKITVCNELIEEDGIYKPVRVINSSEIKSNEKFYFLTDYLDTERGRSYEFKSTIRYPDGTLYNFGKGVKLEATGYHSQYYVSIDPSRDNRMVAGAYELKMYVNSFLTDTYKFTLTE